MSGEDEHAGATGHNHAHGVQPGSDGRWLAAAGLLILAFMGGEIAAGVVAHSLALLSDAAHMLTDAASIGLALVTMKVAARPAGGKYTWGLRRTEILSAQANGITLVLLAIWLGYAAIVRLIRPHPVAGGLMLAVALAGVLVNLAATALISRATKRSPGPQPPGGHDHDHGPGPGQRRSLNVEGAFAHVLTDLWAFIATAAAAIVVLTTGFTRADPIATLIVVALMLHAGWGLIRASGRIFLEAAPAGMDLAELGRAMAAWPCVAEVHDLHVWEITNGMPAASAHVLVDRGQDCHRIRADLEQLLADRGITHATLQVDHVPTAEARATHPEATGTHCGEPHGPSYRAASVSSEQLGLNSPGRDREPRLVRGGRDGRRGGGRAAAPGREDVVRRARDHEPHQPGDVGSAQCRGHGSLEPRVRGIHERDLHRDRGQEDKDGAPVDGSVPSCRLEDLRHVVLPPAHEIVVDQVDRGPGDHDVEQE
jgi:cobalt-zinc-cadmium efflux system protein